MRVIVVGCGRVGSELAVRLQREGHSVAVIDKNANAFRRLPDAWEGETVVGFGFDRDDLLQAGIHEASAVAAVTSGDNTNILTARIARETFEIPRVVARIYDPRRAIIYQRLGIPTVATVSWTVDQVVRRLLPEEAVTAWTDPTGEVNMVEHQLPESFCGQSYTELADGDRFRPVMVTRGGQARLVGPNLVGQEGDLVYFAVRSDAVDDLDRRLAGTGAGARVAGRAGRARGAVGAGDGGGGAVAGGAGGAGGADGGRSS
ncbi:MAG TPA: TrkA family potassium uptake protein [Acidimicrobiales bacterium]